MGQVSGVSKCLYKCGCSNNLLVTNAAGAHHEFPSCGGGTACDVGDYCCDGCVGFEIDAVGESFQRHLA